MKVAVLRVMLNLSEQVGHALERSAAIGLLSDQAKPARDLIEPGCIGRREVHVETRSSGQLRFDFRMFVRGMVIDDQVHVEVLRHVRFDVTEYDSSYVSSHRSRMFNNE